MKIISLLAMTIFLVSVFTYASSPPLSDDAIITNVSILKYNGENGKPFIEIKSRDPGKLIEGGSSLTGHVMVYTGIEAIDGTKFYTSVAGFYPDEVKGYKDVFNDIYSTKGEVKFTYNDMQTNKSFFTYVTDKQLSLIRYIISNQTKYTLWKDNCVGMQMTIAHAIGLDLKERGTYVDFTTPSALVDMLNKNNNENTAIDFAKSELKRMTSEREKAVTDTKIYFPHGPEHPIPHTPGPPGAAGGGGDLNNPDNRPGEGSHFPGNHSGVGSSGSGPGGGSSSGATKSSNGSSSNEGNFIMCLDNYSVCS
ncbi:hypothetical protein [Enterobacter sp. TCD1-1]|jgi:hypothetical protein|uniref:hypothetical protein n=1 Tax=Enterobacter sp. TCD1-1 TaxID=1955625 RepID=UPI001E474534|nr:hypothetical protein [Enterobacter sp. TCD1-1]MCB5948626.1 hypothetical protein [Enterobacter sp. TCD1-1]